MHYDIDIEFDLAVSDSAQFVQSGGPAGLDGWVRASAPRHLGDGVEASCVRCEALDERTLELQFCFAHVAAESSWAAVASAVEVLNNTMAGVLLRPNDTLRIAARSSTPRGSADGETATEGGLPSWVARVSRHPVFV